MCNTAFSVFLDTEQPHETFAKLKGQVFFRLYSDRINPADGHHYPNVMLAESAHVRLEDIPNLAKSANAPVGWTHFDMSYNLIGGTAYWVSILSTLDPAVINPSLNDWPAVYWIQDPTITTLDDFRVYLWNCADASHKDTWGLLAYDRSAGHPAFQTYSYSPVNPPQPVPSNP